MIVLGLKPRFGKDRFLNIEVVRYHLYVILI